MSEQAPENGVVEKFRSFRKWVRQEIRAVLAIFFWLHAIGLTHLVKTRFAVKFSDSNTISEVTLLSVIFFYSYLATNGWWSLFFDLTYVYVFPLWMALKYGWKATKVTLWRKLQKIVSSELTIPTQTAPANPQNPSKQPPPLRLKDSLIRPFQQFAILWCGIILLSHSKVMTTIGVAVVLPAIGKALYTFNRFLNGSMRWLGKFQTNLDERLGKLADQVINCNIGSPEFKNSVNTVKVYRTMLQWLADQIAIERAIRVVSIALVVPYYVYVSILCGFLYLGIAHLLFINWPAKEALIDALFMPLAWTDLPHSLIIRMLAGVQVFVLGYLGYEATFHRLSQKAERITNAAEKLSAKLTSPDVQARVLIIQQPPTGKNQ